MSFGIANRSNQISFLPAQNRPDARLDLIDAVGEMTGSRNRMTLSIFAIALVFTGIAVFRVQPAFR